MTIAMHCRSGQSRTASSPSMRRLRRSNLLSRVLSLALMTLLALSDANAYAQCAGCSNQIPAGLQIDDCRENEDGSAPVNVVTAGGPGGSNVEIRHANLFNGGITVTHVCVRLQSPTGQPAEPGRITLYSTDPNNFGLPGNSIYQENFVISPSLTNHQIVELAIPQNMTADFWVAAEYPTAMSSVPHQYVSDRHVRDSAIFIDAPGLGWEYYDDTNAPDYVGFAPIIRALELGPIQPEACCFPDGSCAELTPADCINQGGTPQGPGTTCASVNCPLPGTCPPTAVIEPEACGNDANGGCNNMPPALTAVSCGDVVCGSAWAENNTRDTDWYSVDLPDADGDGMAELSLDLAADLPLLAGIINTDCANLQFFDNDLADPTTDAHVSACLPAPATYWIFIATADANGDLFNGHPCGSGNEYIFSVSCSEPCSTTPPNDTCPNAISLSCNTTVSGSTVGATPSSPPNCGSASGGAGVWYEIVGSDQQVRIDTCGSADNVNLALYLGSCGNLNCFLDASSDTLGVCADPDDSSLEFFGFNGISYYLYVSPQNQPGSFQINVNCGPANDTCASAEPIGCGQSVSGDTTGATNSGLPICAGLPNTGGDLWYRLVGTGGTVSVDLCDPGTVVNQIISVFTDTCGALTCVDGSFSDQLGICGPSNNSSLSFPTVAGQEYFVVIHPNGPGNTGPFVLNVTCQTTPPNDLCANRLAVGLGTHPADNINALTDGPATACFSGVDDADIWYEFTADCDREYLFAAVATGGPPDRVIELWSDCPQAGGAPLLCNVGSPATVGNFPMVAGETVVIRLGTLPGATGAGVLEIQYQSPCPADLSGPNGVPDCVVDVFDLLDMLAAWGPCPQPCPPACPTDLNGDCVVNVFDLLDLLAAWGSCP